MQHYPFKKIEPTWQERWAGEEIFKAEEDSDKPKKYILDMFPYPSGDGLHVGHVENYSATDILSRYFWMKGYNVLRPQGWDAFGLPAENYAIKSGIHPALTTQKAIQNMKRQINSMGFSYDWTREVNSSKADYYKWTQWLFLLLYKNGLAYRKKAKVNWCESCQTVLANEQAEGGKCERCDNDVVQKDLKQWFFKITDFLEDQEYEGRNIKGLISGLDHVDWPESTILAQKNWIGRSEGAKVKFKVKPVETPSEGMELEVFTTRPDTLFGCTYMVVCPEHELIEKNQEHIINYENVEIYINDARRKTDLERTDLNKEKTGVELVGLVAVNPVNNAEVPIFVADYVLSDYGTGAIMAVPAHDERDWEFAKAHDLNIIQVVKPKRRGTAIIVHGFEGIADSNWYQWAREQLEQIGYKVVVLDMPNASHPELDEWLNALQPYKEGLNDESLIIGHSLGARLALQFIARLNKKIHGLYLVAPVHKTIDFDGLRRRDDMAGSDIDSLERMVKKPIPWPEVKKNTEYIRAILSTNDTFIPLSDTQEYLTEHDILCEILDDRGHFQEKKLEELLDHINSHLKVFVAEGININSSQLDGLETKQAKHEINKWLEENNAGQTSTTFKIRDWLVSRQRFWGAPIPIIYCE